MKQRIDIVWRLALLALAIAAFALCVRGGFFSINPIIPLCKQIAPEEYSGFGPDGGPIPGGGSSGDGPKGTTKKALTWTIVKTQTVGNKTYVLFGTDWGPRHVSDVYHGDTPISKRRPILCLQKFKVETPAPVGLVPLDKVSPGGSLTSSWSSARMLAIPNFLGSDLDSPALADTKCNLMGLMVHGEPGFRMAEFHDGRSKSYAGWSYWVEGYSPLEGLDVESLYWIRINGQNANPW